MSKLLRLVLTLSLAGHWAGCSKKSDPDPASAPPPAKADLSAPPDVAAPPADAKVTESKLAFKVLKKGDGVHRPTSDDDVEMHYSSWTTDGELINSTRKVGRPAKASVRRLMPGWAEGVQLMSKGAKYRFWIPDTPQGTLVYDIELLDVVVGVGPPEDVAAPPATAKKTDSGLAYVVLREGDGGRRPSADGTVTVHYSGWTTDGVRFDSSVVRKKPQTLPLTAVIPGWQEGLQLMTVGAKYRFWIPEKLAYQGRREPRGLLVFDIELRELK